jgi:hypothetical protein
MSERDEIRQRKKISKRIRRKWRESASTSITGQVKILAPVDLPLPDHRRPQDIYERTLDRIEL